MTNALGKIRTASVIKIEDKEDEDLQLRISQAHEYLGLQDLTKGHAGDGYDPDDKWTLERLSTFVASLGRLLGSQPAGVNRIEITPESTVLFCSDREFKTYTMADYPKDWPAILPETIANRKCW